MGHHYDQHARVWKEDEEVREEPCTTFFTPEMRALLDHSKIPHHVAIVPDGNRRWAKKRHTTTGEGHREGADILLNIVKAAKEIGIKILTVYTFSTENWQRPKGEVFALMWLIENYLKKQRAEMVLHDIRLQAIGNYDAMPKSLVDELHATMEATATCQAIDMVLALNYGGRDDIKRAFIKLLNDYKSGAVDDSAITEEVIASYLDTARWKDPDLLIRTSGEVRLSNFLLWQSSYSELYVTEALWPEFSPKELFHALVTYQQRQRRHGGE